MEQELEELQELSIGAVTKTANCRQVSFLVKWNRLWA